MDNTSELKTAMIWHELGHVFCYRVLANLGIDLGDLVAIEFNPKGKCRFESNIFSQSGYWDTFLDCHGFKNRKFTYEVGDSYCKIVNSNSNAAKAQILMSISGGLFNIYYYKVNPSLKDFEKCYNNSDNIHEFEGCAGNDWDRIRKIACCLGWDIKMIEQIRFDLFELYLDIGIFQEIDTVVKMYTDTNFVEKNSIGSCLKNISSLECFDNACYQINLFLKKI